MQKRMVYSVDVGLQIGTPCIGTTIDGREHVGVYLYPEPMSGTHLTFHMEDGSTGSKTDIEPTTEEILRGSVHYESDSDDPGSGESDSDESNSDDNAQPGDGDLSVEAFLTEQDAADHLQPP